VFLGFQKHFQFFDRRGSWQEGSIESAHDGSCPIIQGRSFLGVHSHGLIECQRQHGSEFFFWEVMAFGRHWKNLDVLRRRGEATEPNDASLMSLELFRNDSFIGGNLMGPLGSGLKPKAPLKPEGMGMVFSDTQVNEMFPKLGRGLIHGGMLQKRVTPGHLGIPGEAW